MDIFLIGSNKTGYNNSAMGQNALKTRMPCLGVRIRDMCFPYSTYTCEDARACLQIVKIRETQNIEELTEFLASEDSEVRRHALLQFEKLRNMSSKPALGCL